jgi:ribulose-phosphate 3-epimerase
MLTGRKRAQSWCPAQMRVWPKARDEMFQEVKIAPSILSADFMKMGQEIDMIKRAGAGYVHVDVMDGHFVPNLTMGVPLVKCLKAHTDLPLDVHLMIDNPLREIEWFARAGADLITVHAEVLYGPQLREAVDLIHSFGVRAGVAIKPQTPPEVLAGVIDVVDMVLVMSVEPGFSGQSYIEGSDARVGAVAAMARAAGVAPLIQVDGGMGLKTAGLVSAKGADVLVCGNAVFAAEDPASALAAVERVANDARAAALAAQG